ncbi:hypothetical protein [Alterisphingorhabdus coralli]|uniref:Uncharacterized protein n=1 Tax=Alterisphingorhabdus coralli TaxID=3071408 RepID=A0AA97F6H0_9SPHN|nr:hypothetical protein [Parasphingorhabdus sp. SCSIO 66989]WOE74152.1 hypothetical protein RB602_09825 [Parasphingorhabdus sp. SCSIO 66989]
MARSSTRHGEGSDMIGGDARVAMGLRLGLSVLKGHRVCGVYHHFHGQLRAIDFFYDTTRRIVSISQFSFSQRLSSDVILHN